MHTMNFNGDEAAICLICRRNISYSVLQPQDTLWKNKFEQIDRNMKTKWGIWAKRAAFNGVWAEYLVSVGITFIPNR